MFMANKTFCLSVCLSVWQKQQACEETAWKETSKISLVCLTLCLCLCQLSTFCTYYIINTHKPVIHQTENPSFRNSTLRCLSIRFFFHCRYIMCVYLVSLLCGSAIITKVDLVIKMTVPDVIYISIWDCGPTYVSLLSLHWRMFPYFVWLPKIT